MLLAVSMAPQEIGQRIALARTAKGWTQEKFAQQANVSLSTVQRWESGKVPPVRELIRVAEVLGISSSDLVEQSAFGEQAREDRILEQVSGLREQIDRIEKLVQSLLTRSA